MEDDEMRIREEQDKKMRMEQILKKGQVKMTQTDKCVPCSENTPKSYLNCTTLKCETQKYLFVSFSKPSTYMLLYKNSPKKLFNW